MKKTKIKRLVEKLVEVELEKRLKVKTEEGVDSDERVKPEYLNSAPFVVKQRQRPIFDGRAGA